MTVDQQFNILNDKLHQLLKQYHRLQKENEGLRLELQQMKDKEETTYQRIDELEQQVSILKIAAGDLNEKDKKEFEKKINQYIKQIDKCISFLSQ
jgi:cell division septum initiation protein DivIVA